MIIGKVQWNDADMSVNIVEIDKQHKALVNLVNNLFDAVKDGKSNTIFNKLITDLVQYTKVHFSAEEIFLDQYAYPATLYHKNKHKEFIERVLQFKKDFEAGKTGLTTGVLSFLRDWLVEHIMKEDRKYSRFLNEKGVK